MIRQAREAYRYAFDQEVDLRRTPCIYDDGGDWVVVVDYERGTLPGAGRECPTFAAGQATHVVVLDPDGTVVASR
jgi:hypothetical protein